MQACISLDKSFDFKDVINREGENWVKEKYNIALLEIKRNQLKRL